MVVDWHWNICRGLSRTCPTPASWGRETSAPRTPCESERKSTWVEREEGSWWFVDTNVRVSIIHPSLMVSSILRASFRYCFSAWVTNSNIISLAPSLYTTSHLSRPHQAHLLWRPLPQPVQYHIQIGLHVLVLNVMFWATLLKSFLHRYMHNSRQLTTKDWIEIELKNI